jgi:hypothetical protein
MTREEFLKLADSKWTEIESLQQNDFYEFEKQFEVILVEMGRKALEGVLGKVPQDYRKKKTVDPFRGSRD